MLKIKYLFIGAGPANLAAAAVLAGQGRDDFLILEQGEPLAERRCPGVSRGVCAACEGGCALAGGVGGANALHGNKLCYFPASSQVLRFFSPRVREEVFTLLQELAYPYIDMRLCAQEKDLSPQKNYVSDVLSSRHFRELVNCFTEKIAGRILSRSRVSDFSRGNGVFEVLTASGQAYETENLIIATGRSSFRTLHRWLRKLGVPATPLCQDIGIRLESRKENFTPLYYYQNDPKLKFPFPGRGSGRTFCAHNQGAVVPVRLGNAFFADGAFLSRFGEYNNLALMVRGLRALEEETLEAWCADVNRRSGKLLLGSLDLALPPESIARGIMNLLPAFPAGGYGSMLHELLLRFLVGPHALFRKGGKGESQLKVYGPAVDRYWIKPELGADFAVAAHSNLFILGDAAGLSRGFIQAMFSGAAWAVTRSRQSEGVKKSQWLSLV